MSTTFFVLVMVTVTANNSALTSQRVAEYPTEEACIQSSAQAKFERSTEGTRTFFVCIPMNWGGG